MEDDRNDRSNLEAAGYTGLRAAIVFCTVLAVVGALFGSVAFAILWNMAVPGTSESTATWVGSSAGALLAVWIGVIKVRRGNSEAVEHMEDKHWRRMMLRHRDE